MANLKVQRGILTAGGHGVWHNKPYTVSCICLKIATRSMAYMQERKTVGSEWLAVPRVGLDITVKCQDEPLLSRSQRDVDHCSFNRGVLILLRCNIAGI